MTLVGKSGPVAIVWGMAASNTRLPEGEELRESQPA